MMMHIRTASIAPGKVPEALDFARQAIALIRERTGVEVRVTTALGGDQSRLALFAQFDALGAYETQMARLADDPRWQTLLSANAGTFLPGSAHDRIWGVSSGTPTRGKQLGYEAAGYSKNPLPDLRPR